MKTISNFEKIKPAVGIAENNRFGRVIHDNAGYLCAKYTNVVGLGINNVRCIGDNIIPQPYILIYCLDKSIIPYGENKLPETIQGYSCDLREDMVIMFGTSMECRYENPNPGCSVGMSFKHEFGSAGFWAKSNATLENPVTGFLSAAHVVIQELHKLYQAESLLSDSAGKKSYIIVHASLGDSANSQYIGEVVES